MKEGRKGRKWMKMERMILSLELETTLVSLAFHCDLLHRKDLETHLQVERLDIFVSLLNERPVPVGTASRYRGTWRTDNKKRGKRKKEHKNNYFSPKLEGRTDARTINKSLILTPFCRAPHTRANCE
jgi:hypothetical protein